MSRYTVCPLLGKKDKGRGKTVTYWLTRKARKRYALKLPLIKIESEREIAYQLLFYYLQPDLNHSILSYDTISEYTFRSEEEFRTFLSRIHMSKEDFHVTYQKYDEVNRCNFVRMINNYENIEISKREYTDKERCVYRYLVPGISPRDISRGDKVGYVFEHLFDPGVTKRPLNISEIQELFDILEKEGLIGKITSPILEYLKEIRYDIILPELREFFRDCWLSLFGGSVTRTTLILKNIRRPRKEEIEWYNMIWGRRRANTLFGNYNISLNKKNPDEKSLKSIYEDIKNIDEALPNKFKSINSKYKDLIKKYHYPSDALLEITYPQFLRELHTKQKK